MGMKGQPCPRFLCGKCYRPRRPVATAITTEHLFSTEYFHAIRVVILHNKNILRVIAADSTSGVTWMSHAPRMRLRSALSDTMIVGNWIGLSCPWFDGRHHGQPARTPRPVTAGTPHLSRGPASAVLPVF